MYVCGAGEDTPHALQNDIRDTRVADMSSRTSMLLERLDELLSL